MLDVSEDRLWLVSALQGNDHTKAMVLNDSLLNAELGDYPTGRRLDAVLSVVRKLKDGEWPADPNSIKTTKSMQVVLGPERGRWRVNTLL